MLYSRVSIKRLLIVLDVNIILDVYTFIPNVFYLFPSSKLIQPKDIRGIRLTRPADFTDPVTGYSCISFYYLMLTLLFVIAVKTLCCVVDIYIVL